MSLHGWLIFMVNVGKYTSPMDPMGYIYIYIISIYLQISIEISHFRVFRSLENHLAQRLQPRFMSARWAWNSFGVKSKSSTGPLRLPNFFPVKLMDRWHGVPWSQDFRFGIGISIQMIKWWSYIFFTYIYIYMWSRMGYWLYGMLWF